MTWTDDLPADHTHQQWLDFLDRHGCPPQPDDQLEWEDRQRQWLTRGQWIVENRLGSVCLSQADWMAAIWPYMRNCREQVLRHGSCHRQGCRVEDLVDAHGDVICFRTRQPCPLRQLGPTIKAWSIIGND